MSAAATRLMSLVVEATEHAHRIEVIIEDKAKSAAEAVANAVTPELQAGIEALTAKLKSTRELHESVAATGAAAAAAVTATTTPTTATVL